MSATFLSQSYLINMDKALKQFESIEENLRFVHKHFNVD